MFALLILSGKDILSSKSWPWPLARGCFEDQSTWRMYRRRFDYEIYRVNAAGKASRLLGSGRETHWVRSGKVSVVVVVVLVMGVVVVVNEVVVVVVVAAA